MIRIGYVGLNTELETASKTLKLASYTEERMLELVQSNLNALTHILLWNSEHNITVFRISSQLIPFGSHPINSGKWKTVFKKEFHQLGELVKENNLKLSMHPGQYAVLNSPNPVTYLSTLADLDYHVSILEAMNLDSTHKIVLHGGGAYGNNRTSLNSLKQRIESLPSRISQRIVLENDERIFSAQEIYNVCRATGSPGVFDVFHHQILPSFDDESLRSVILLFNKTWHTNERQEIHYSNQNPHKQRGAHSQSIDIAEFGKFYELVKDLELDIMLEVKDKQQSVLLLRQHFPQIH